jgi:hypothetical protein
MIKLYLSVTNDATTVDNSDKEIQNNNNNNKLSPAKLQAAKKNTLANKSNTSRFGFRQNNTIRPTSGFAPKLNEYDSLNNNSNAVDTERNRQRIRSARANFIGINITPTKQNVEQKAFKNFIAEAQSPSPTLATSSSSFANQNEAVHANAK